ncbi:MULTISPECIES: LysR family transcriptional regulator [unclassified Nitratireductor]|uniref:LysR family transcriptional regulator n=1 Tax=unclassified Nitratireductor TaxID=2641084 RepID=UPI0025FAC2C9|nr:LysR family transcriptional regulator [Nitratireductor sp.]
MVLRRHLPSPSTLFVFEVAARHSNFSKAADELNITQPAVSHAVASLEKHLGEKLFIRSGPNLALTEAGKKLSRVTTRAFHSIEDVLDEIEGRDGTREVVMLSISSGMATHWLMPRYSSFREQFPNTDLQFQLLPGSVGGPLANCDLGLRVAAGDDARKLGGWFAPERVLAIGAPGYVRERGTFDTPVSPHTLINLPDHWFGWSEFALEAGRRIPTTWNQLSFSDYSVVLQAALSGQGLALGWTSVVSRLVIDGMLVSASDRVILTDRSYHLVSSSQRAIRPVVELVRDWLIAEMEQEERQLAKMLG